MKSINNLLYKLTLFSLISFCCNNLSFGQEKVNISTGIGVPEMLNVGVRYQLKQAQLGIGFGFMPIKDESVISVSCDGFYHFAGLSELSSRRTWYGRMGLNYMRDETTTWLINTCISTYVLGGILIFPGSWGFRLMLGLFSNYLMKQ